MDNVAEYKLKYFPIRGRAQAIRYLLKDNGIDFEDIPPQNWAKEKATTPFGQLPVLYHKDKPIAQSGAMLRYLGRKFKLYQGDEDELYRIDMINDAVEDLRKAYSRLIYEDFKNDERKSAFVNSLPEQLGKLDTLMASWGTKYVLQEVSFVDYNFFDMLDILQILSPTCLDNCPALTGYFERMKEREKLKAYRESEEFKKLPINGNENK